MSYSDPSRGEADGAQPCIGVPPASMTNFFRPTSIDGVSGEHSNDSDDSIVTAIVGAQPKPGKRTSAPTEKHYMSVRRNIKTWLAALGSVSQSTLTAGQSYRQTVTASATRANKRYFSREYDMSGRVYTHVDCEPTGFAVKATNKFFDVSVPMAGRYVSGCQFFPTHTVTVGTYNGRLFTEGHSRDDDAAGLTYEIDIVAGGVPGTATARTKVSGGTYSPTRTIPINEPFDIIDNTTKSGLTVIFPYGSATGTVATYTGLAGDTVTVTVTNAGGATATVLTEGVDWTAATSNAVTAQSLARAIRTLVAGASADVGSPTATGVVRLYRTGNTTAISLATSDAVNFTPIVTETTGSTLGIGDHWTISTRGTATAATITSDTLFTWNSIEVATLTWGGSVFRIKPQEFSLDWKRGLRTGDFVGGSRYVVDHPQETHGEMQVGFKVRIEDKQYINQMVNRVQKGVVVTCSGDYIGSSTDPERISFSLPYCTIVPFKEDMNTTFLQDVDFVCVANDSAIGANDFVSVVVDSGIQYVTE